MVGQVTEQNHRGTVFFNLTSFAGAVLQQQLCWCGAVGGPGGGCTEHNTGGTIYLTELLVQVLYCNNNYAGVVLLVGQGADGLSTTLVGLSI
jgi:hypothetical protein